MPVYLDVEIRGAQAAAAAAAKDIISVFDGVGRGINKGLGNALSEGLKSFSTASSREQIELLQRKLVEAGQAEFLLAQKAEAASVRSVAAWHAAEDAVNKYGAASVRATKATASAIDASAVATVAANKHTKSVEDNKAAHDDLTAALAGSTGAITGFHKAATIASAGVVGGFVAAAIDATKAAGNFQVQLVRLETVGGELPRNLKTIHDGLMSLASTTGWNPTELATGMLKVEQAGYRGTEALTVMKAAAQAAAEEGVGLDEAANAVTTSLHDYHLGANQAADVTSKIAEAARLGKTTFSEFTASLHNVEPTAAAVGESLNDLLSTLGMLTQSGMHPDQASQNLNHALSSLGNIQPKQREMLAAIGLDPRQIPEDIKSKGYIGTAQEIRAAVDRRIGPNGNVILDAFENNPASQALEHEQYGNLSPAEKAVADRIMSGQLSQKDFRKSRGGLGVTEAKIVDQWMQTHENNQGFNRVLKSLNTDQLGVMQALQTAVGGQDNARTLLQVTDQNNPDAVQHRQEIADAHADPNGDILEWKRSQQNFNAQWKDLKASVESLKIEFGEDFLPTATKWVHSLESGVHWMQQHRALVKDLIEDVTVLSGLFLGMKLSTGLVKTVKDFRAEFGLTKKVADQVNTSLRESGPAAQAGSIGVKTASKEEETAQDRVKTAVYQADDALRQSGDAAKQGAAGVNSAATEEVEAQNRVKTASAEADAQLRDAGPSAETGAAGVVNAANTEISAMNRVIGAAGRAKGALAGVGSMALSLGGDALQANTRENTNPHKLGVIASDAGNMAMVGGAIGSVIPGVGTLLGAGIGGALGGGYALWDQYFSGDHDVAAPDNANADMGPVPLPPEQPTPDVAQPTPDVTPPTPESQPETPDMPYTGGDGGGKGKKHKDTDPLDEDLKRIERLQTEANEIQGRIAQDRASNDPARRGEIPWLQKKLDEINRELAGISGKGRSRGQEPWMPVKLDDNWFQGGLPGLVKNTVGFLEDLVLGPLEVAAFHGIPDFEGAGGKSSRHSRGGGVRRSHEEGLGAEGPGEGSANLPTPLTSTFSSSRGAGSGVVPVFVTNWASGGPGGGGRGGADSGGAGSGYGGGETGGSGGGADLNLASSTSSLGMGGPGGSPATLGALAAGAPMPAPGQPSPAAVHPDLNGPDPGGFIPTAWGAGAQDRRLRDYIISRGKQLGLPDNVVVAALEAWGGESGFRAHPPIGDSGLAHGPYQIHPGQAGTFGIDGPDLDNPLKNVDAWYYAYQHGRHTDPNAPANLIAQNVELSGTGQGNQGRANYGVHAQAAHQMLEDYNRRNPSGPPVSADNTPGTFAVGGQRFTPGMHLLPGEYLGPDGIVHVQGPPSAAATSPPTPSMGMPVAQQLEAMGVEQRHQLLKDVFTAPPRMTHPIPGVPIGPSRAYALGGLVKYFADGGPSGTDTIPAWLSPGEFVMNSDATRQYLPYLQSMNKGARFSTGGMVPQYWEPGTTQPVQPSQPAPPQQPSARGTLPNVSGPGTPKDKGSGTSMHDAAIPGAPQPPSPGAAGALPTGGGAESPGDQKAMAGAPKPGADVQQPGENMPASPGIGFSGGIIGAAEGAAEAGASGLNVMAPGAGSAASAAMQIGFQELNRAAAYGAQAAGIAAKGLLEAFTVNSSSTGGDWSETIPGRLLSGIAGVRPSQNTAGQTKTPLAGDQNAGYADASGGDTHHHYENHFNGPVTVQANDPMELHGAMQQFNQQQTMGEYRYPMSGINPALMGRQ